MAKSNRPERLTIATGLPDMVWLFTDDGSRTLLNEALDESYHSGCGAVAESLVVYLLNSGVLQRLAMGQTTRVLEYGFGTGTSFWLTAAVAELFQTPLDYVGLESNLLSSRLLAQLELAPAVESCGAMLPALTTSQAAGDCEGLRDLTPGRVGELADRLLRRWLRLRCQLAEQPEPGRYDFWLSDYVRLSIELGDAIVWSQPDERVKDCLCVPGVEGKNQEVRSSDCSEFHAIYFDPFCPEVAPEFWQEGVFRIAFQRLLPGGSLASYCVKGPVRRKLAEVGFAVGKAAGPRDGKREVLIALKPSHSH